MMKFTMISLAMFARWSIISGVIFFGGVTAANGTVLIEPSGMCGPNCVTYRISLAGPIDNRMLADFTKATEDPLVKEEHEKHIGPIVSLNSPGGSIVDAMAIGNLIRSQGYITFVFEENECSSACVLVLAAGVKRFVPSKKIGVHRPHFDEQMFAKLSQSDARKKYEDMAEGVRKYLTSMGVSESLYPAMLRVSSDRIKYLSYIELKSYGLEGEDAAFSEWERARAIQMLGRDQYEINQSYMSVLIACSNKLGSMETCGKKIKPEFMEQLEVCLREPANNYSGCAKQIERRMAARYR